MKTQLDRDEREVGLVIVPAIFDQPGSEPLGLAAYVSRVVFGGCDRRLAPGFLATEPEDQMDLLPAFFRHTPLEVTHDHQALLADGWRQYLMANLKVELDGSFLWVQLDTEPVLLGVCLTTSRAFLQQFFREQLANITIETDDQGRHRYRLADGHLSSRRFRSFGTLGRHLDHLTSVGSAKPYGFFHNQTKYYSCIARFAIDDEWAFDDLVEASPEAFERLCAVEGVTPHDIERVELSEVMGKWSRSRKTEGER